MRRAMMAVFGALSLVLLGCGKTSTQKSGELDAVSRNSLSDVFEVIDFLPGEELPSTVKYPSIQLQFSEPVVPLSKLGEPSNKNDFVTIEPPLKGTFRWYGTSLLSFDSSDEIIAQRQYTVKIKSDMVSASGKTISGNLLYNFHTEELKLKSIIPGYSTIQEGVFVDEDSVPLEQAKDIALVFNAPVDADEIKKYISVTSNNATYNFTARTVENPQKNDRDNFILCLSLSEAPLEDASVAVTVAAGAKADKDAFPTSKEVSKEFHTIRPFVLDGFDGERGRYYYYEYSNPVMFTFSSTLKEGQEESLANNISVSLNTSVTKENVAIRGKYLIVHGLPVTYDSTYTIKLSGQLEDIYGRKLNISSPIVNTVTVPKAASYASFKNSGIKMLEAQFEPRLAFQFQNVKEGSAYNLTTLTTANGIGLPLSSDTTLIDSGYPENTKIVKTVDLAPYLEKTASGEYHGAVRFTADVAYEYRWKDWRTQVTRSRIDHNTNEQVVQVTDLGLTVRYGYDKAAVLVTSLKTGEPVQGAVVSAYRSPANDNDWMRVHSAYRALASATTDANGLAVVNFPKGLISSLKSDVLLIEAKTKDDRAIFNPRGHSMWRFSLANYEYPSDAEKEQRIAFLFTDRGLYKPGEKVTFRGIDRNLQLGEYTPYTGEYSVSLQERGWRPKVFDTIKGTASSNGTFWGTFTIPKDLEPGTYEISYNRDGVEVEACTIQVQFFERLTFEANSSIPSVTYYRGDFISAQVSAQYLGGGALNDCAYSAHWTMEPIMFQPKGKDFADMSFGPLQGYEGRNYVGSSEGVLSGEGKASVTQKTGSEKLKGKAYSYRMEAQVTDSGNNAISTVSSAIVHPASFYIGLSNIKNVKGFSKKGDTLKFDYVCVTPEGTAPSSSFLPQGDDRKLSIELLREDWKEVQQVAWDGRLTTRYERVMVSEEVKSVPLSGSLSKTEISVTPPKGGAYVLRLSGEDAEGRDVITETRFYVTSSDWYLWSRDFAEEITLTTDKESYEVGETAQILMRSPLPKGRYLISIEREGILSQEVKVIEEPTSVLSFTIKENYVPVMYVALSSYSLRTDSPAKNYEDKDLGKPQGYFGVVPLHVSTATKSFDIAVSTDKALYRPGEKATVTLKATTKSGKPVSGAEITLMAVDRGVIDLINYHVPNPVAYFYREYLFPNCITGGDSRSILMDPITYTTSNLVGGDSDSKIEERKNFDPTAVFVPSLVTDAGGKATYTFTLPDTLTAYRITAVGVDSNNFAISEDELSVANPVSVRTLQPRKLRLNDQSEIGVTITNLEELSHSVTIQMSVKDGFEEAVTEDSDEEIQKTAGHAVLVGDTSKSVSVGGQKTSPLMFSIKGETPGWITVEYTVKSDVVNERIIMPLEIEKPYIYETVTTVGNVRTEGSGKAHAEETLIIPSDAADGKGSLYVQLDPTRLGVLREAVDYVFHSPYDGLEQRSSAILPLMAFGEYIKVFGLEGEVKNPQKVALKELKKIASSQRADGGFPYWPDGTVSNVYVSARIAEIAGIALKKDYKLPAKLNIKALASYLIGRANDQMQTYSDRNWVYYDAMHLYYAASLIGGTVDESYLERIAKIDDIDVCTLALCGLTYANLGKTEKASSIAKKIKHTFKMSTRGVEIAEPQYNDYWSFFMDSSEKYALCLQLFSFTEPKEDINQRLVYELLQLQKAQKGRWSSTATTARVLTAFDEYIRANNLAKLDFTAEVLLNKERVLSGSFKGLSSVAEETVLPFGEKPLSSLPKDRSLHLTFTKDGEGDLFYTASMKYAIPTAEQTAREEGICIFTEITDVKTGEVVTGNNLVAGNIYKEKVFISTTRNREFVAVRAPVPAGAEILNAAFVTTGTVPNRSEDTEEEADWSYDKWYESYNWGLSYQGIYDSEVQYFWDYLPRGSQTVEFMFRAVRKGEFGTPCSTAECMYQEEIFGRSNGKVWTIE